MPSLEPLMEKKKRKRHSTAYELSYIISGSTVCSIEEHFQNTKAFSLTIVSSLNLFIDVMHIYIIVV